MKALHLFMIGAFVVASTPAVALDRSVALPYQYNSGSSGMYVPKNCSITQYVAVSGTALVCRELPVASLPDCGAGKYLTVNGTSLGCEIVPSSTTVTVPNCNANQRLTGNGTSFTCADLPTAVTPTAGFSSVRQVYAHGEDPVGYGWPVARAACADGEILTGGGAACYNGAGWIWINTSRPDGNAWLGTCDATNDARSRRAVGKIDVWALCAK